MTAQDYLKQNLAGFENDSFARDKMKSIIQDHGITTVIETGSYLGATTKHFARWCDKVYTIEINEENYNKARKNLKGTNVKQFLGSSDEVLDDILHDIDKHENVFIFCDAHWLEHNPLLNELAVIAKHGLKPIISVHDFLVPNHPELGYDTYGTIVYEWDWIKRSVENIYGKDGYTIEYNSEATGAKRGIIYIFPK